MSDKVSGAFSIWANLTTSERSEVIDIINKFQRGDDETRKQLKLIHSISLESLSENFVRSSTSMNFGPLAGQPCTKCGRL